MPIGDLDIIMLHCTSYHSYDKPSSIQQELVLGLFLLFSASRFLTLLEPPPPMNEPNISTADLDEIHLSNLSEVPVPFPASFDVRCVAFELFKNIGKISASKTKEVEQWYAGIKHAGQMRLIQLLPPRPGFDDDNFDVKSKVCLRHGGY